MKRDFIKDLIIAETNAIEMLVKELKEYVRANGEIMNERFYDEFGMVEEDIPGSKIIKVLDTSKTGCFFSHQLTVNDNNLNDDTGIDKLEESFEYTTYWAFYIVNECGYEMLYYYGFHNNGICYQDYSEPIHDYVLNLSLAEIAYIFEAIINA